MNLQISFQCFDSKDKIMVVPLQPTYNGISVNLERCMDE